MSLEEAITKAYFPITYMFETKECYNFQFVSKEFYLIFHNNGFLLKVTLDGYKYNYIELINQLFSQIEYATKMSVSDLKDPHYLPEFTRSVKMVDCPFRFFDPMYTITRLKYLDINNERDYEYSSINWAKIPNIETFIYTGTNIKFEGIENCKNLHTVILKKYNKIVNGRIFDSKQIPHQILLLKNLEVLITDADISNLEIISKKFKYLVCKGFNVKINSNKEVLYYDCGITKRYKPGSHILNQYENNKKVSFSDWNVDTFISCASYSLFIDLSI